MMPIIRPIILVILFACSNHTQTTIVALPGSSSNIADAMNADFEHGPQIYGLDTTYEISKVHSPFFVTGYFNTDRILDTAILITHKPSARLALYIKHGGTSKAFLLKNGRDVGTDFDNFNWVGRFEIITKGTTIWNNVIGGEIVDVNEVPDDKKIILRTDAMFVHVEEASGGGIIYFRNGRYVWVQQD